MKHVELSSPAPGGNKRPQYFDRQQLTAADLNLGLDYLRKRLRVRNRFLHGWGVSCGARVSIHGPSKQPGLISEEHNQPTEFIETPTPGSSTFGEGLMLGRPLTPDTFRELERLLATEPESLGTAFVEIMAAQPRSGSWEVEVSEGYALSPHGDEIYIPYTAVIDVAEKLKACMDKAEPCAEPDVPIDANEPDVMQCIDFSSRQPGATFANPLIVDDVSFLISDFTGGLAKETQITSLQDFVGLDCGASTHIALRAPAPAVSLTLLHTAIPATIRVFNSSGDIIDEAKLPEAMEGPQTLSFSGEEIGGVSIQAPQNETILLDFCRLAPVVDTFCAYLVVCPAEVDECPTPAIPKDCLPPGSHTAYSRKRETFQFEILCELPDMPTDLSCEELQAIVCGNAHAPCPPSIKETVNCLVLAKINFTENGIVSIDDLSDRRRLWSDSLIQSYIQCLCGEPAPQPTEFVPSEFVPSEFVPSEFVPTEFVPSEFIPSEFIPTEFVPTEFVPSEFFPTEFVPSEFIPSEFVPSEFEPPIPSLFTGAGPDFGFNPDEFDLERGRTLPVTRISGIGGVRRDRLIEAGINNVLEFAALRSDRAAEIMGISEVKVAEMQERARELMRR